MQIRIATQKDAGSIREIYRPFIEGHWTSFETDVPSTTEMWERIRKTLISTPWIVAEIDDQVAGYAYSNAHRWRAAYRWSKEVSVYVGNGYRGRGLGRILYSALFDILRVQNVHLVLAGVSLPNDPSMKFHENMGFKPVGVYEEAGYKNGVWRDIAWWQKKISDDGRPAEPIDFSLLDRDLVAQILKQHSSTGA